MKLITGSSNRSFSEKLATALEVPIAQVEISEFANGEKRVWIQESIQGENCVLVQSFYQKPDEFIMEFLLLADALERMGARHVNAVIPWLGYSLQDKVFREGEPIAAKVVAQLASNAYIKRVYLLDVHNSSLPGFFSIPTVHISALDLFATYIKNTFDTANCMIASPDFGGMKRARVLANTLNYELVNIDKHRDLNTGAVTAMDLAGADVTGKTIVIFDDCILSGGTVLEASKLLKSRGAAQVHFLATHGVFTPGAVEKLAESPEVDSIVISNSIHHHDLPKKFKVLDVSQLFADKITLWK